MSTEGISAALEQCRRTREEALAGFKTLLRFPSVSLDDEFQPQLLACADWILEEMRRIGLENVTGAADRRQSDSVRRLAACRRRQADPPLLRPL